MNGCPWRTDATSLPVAAMARSPISSEASREHQCLFINVAESRATTVDELSESGTELRCGSLLVGFVSEAVLRIEDWAATRDWDARAALRSLKDAFVGDADVRVDPEGQLLHILQID